MNEQRGGMFPVAWTSGMYLHLSPLEKTTAKCMDVGDDF